MEHTWSQYLFSLANWCSYSEMYPTDDNDLMISPVNSDLSYSVQTQIYLLEKLSNIYLSKFVLNENINRILNNLHELAKDFSKNLHTADNLRQRIIELIINLQVFYNNKNVFNEDDLNLLKEFREQFISFVTYLAELYEYNIFMDRFLLQRKCKKCQELMHLIMGIRLNREKHDRIDFIFSFISNTEFIKYVFDSKAALNAAIIKEIITDLGSLAREGLI